MPQMLLFADPRPLVERLGRGFFLQAPEGPGVYLMRDRIDTVLYVGKAKNLRRRLASYRVANPDRMVRRHLRMLRAVERIEIQECVDETAALARESKLLRSLRPRFNRAGTWPGPARFLVWRVTEAGLEFGVTQTIDSGWHSHGPLGASALALRTALVRLLWSTLYAERGLAGMPEGWFGGRYGEVATIPRQGVDVTIFERTVTRVNELFEGGVDKFMEWVREQTLTQTHPFECSVREADLQFVSEFGL